jgi:MFS family permease
MAGGNLLVGLGIAGIGLAPQLWLAFAASVAGGFGNGAANVAQSTLVSRRLDARWHGRAFAATGAVMQTAIGVGTLGGPLLVTTLGAGHAMAVAGGFCAVAALAGFAGTRDQSGVALEGALPLRHTDLGPRPESNRRPPAP